MPRPRIGTKALATRALYCSAYSPSPDNNQLGVRALEQLESVLTRDRRARLAGEWVAGRQATEAELQAFDGDSALELRLALVRSCVDETIFTQHREAHRRSQRLLDEVRVAAASSLSIRLEATLEDLIGLHAHAGFLMDRPAGYPAIILSAFEAALKLRRAGDLALLAESLFHVGLAQQVGHQDEAAGQPWLDESYRLAIAAGDDVTASYAIRHIAVGHRARGQKEVARAALVKSWELRRSAAFRPGAAAALVTLAQFDLEHGAFDLARRELADVRGDLEELDMAPFLRLAEGLERDLAADESA